MTFISTKQAARVLGVSPGKLQQDLWHERMTPPPDKSPSGGYLWGNADIERYSWQVLRRPYTGPKLGER